MIDSLLDEMFALSEEVETHGKTWLIVRHLRKNYYIAVEKGAKCPVPLSLIYYAKTSDDGDEG